jgi:hypothetical protein
MKQLTLTGVRQLNTGDFMKENGDYTRVINALWREEKVGTDKDVFQKQATQKWKTVYKGHKDKIESFGIIFV